MNYRNIKISILGLGYVGLPLLISLTQKVKVIGYDSNKSRIIELNNFYDRNNAIEKKSFIKNSKNFLFTNKIEELIDTNLFIITVPTPITKKNKPNLKYIKKSLLDICKLSRIKKQSKIYIVLESTVYPGCTEGYCKDILEKNSNMKYKKDFLLGYSPERINPGDKVNNLRNTTKLISGTNKNILNTLNKIYSIVSKRVYATRNIKTAEAAKVIENTQRDINIALVNEFSNIFNKLQINTNDVLAAASTKWNFLNFTPGLVGGHCIGVDPYYLSYIAKKNGAKANLILAGRSVNESYVNEIFKRIKKLLKTKSISNPSTLLMGLTFKENVPDFRNSKNLELLKKISTISSRIVALDPYIKNLNTIDKNKKKIHLTKDIKYIKKFKYDVIIILLFHKEFKSLNKNLLKSLLKNKNSFIFDFKNTYNEKNFLSI